MSERPDWNAIYAAVVWSEVEEFDHGDGPGLQCQTTLPDGRVLHVGLDLSPGGAFFAFSIGGEEEGSVWRTIPRAAVERLLAAAPPPESPTDE